jgi:hypothetical protein
MRWTAVSLLLAALAGGAAAGAGGDADLRRLFPRAAEIVVAPPGGLARLALPADVLSACRPDLADLRVFDARGREVAYLVDAGPAMRAPVEVSARAPAVVLAARREEVRRAAEPALQRETYVLDAPPAGTDVTTWELVFETDRARFVRRVDVSAEAADGAAVVLVDNASIFRLPNVRNDRTRVALPPVAGARLTVTVEGDDGSWLEPRLAFAGTHVVGGHAEAVVTLEAISQQRADGRTVVELARPRGLVPDVLRLDSESAAFERMVEVFDAGPGLDGGSSVRRPSSAWRP